MDYFDKLPPEITQDILSRVPVESVLECKLVSRNWRRVISHGSFSKLHFNRHLNNAGNSGKLGFFATTMPFGDIDNTNFQYFEYNPNREPTEAIERITRLNFNQGFTSFVGSCNGLICLSVYLVESTTYCICNPITREHVMLPEISRVGAYDEVSGFGCDTSKKEYKVVRVVLDKTEFVEVYIYTLGSRLGWRNLGKFKFGTRHSCGGEGLFVNGALYWLDRGSQKIVPFDLAEEKFCGHVPLPLPLEGWCQIGVLDGCLSFAIYHIVDDVTGYSDVWLLENKDDNHGMKEGEGHHSLGWSEVFRAYGRDLFAGTKSHGILSYELNHINIHSPGASVSKTIVEFKELFTEVFPHQNTLVSLRELGEEDTKMMEPVEIKETEALINHFNQL